MVERPEIEIDASLTFSEKEILQAKDFAQMSAEEIARAKREIRNLVMPMDTVPARRRVPAARAGEIDMRRTIRASLRTGGAIIPLAFRERKAVHPPIVALVDISGSMSQYSRLFLHFLHALSERGGGHDVSVRDPAHQRDAPARGQGPDEALAACSAAVPDWSGGTRIGETLRQFNRLWSRRCFRGGPIVLLITDGLEREGIDGLARETDRLHRSCRRLVWLNPLLRFEGFEAKAGASAPSCPTWTNSGRSIRWRRWPIFVQRWVRRRIGATIRAGGYCRRLRIRLRTALAALRQIRC